MHRNIKSSLRAHNNNKPAPTYNDFYNIKMGLGTFSGRQLVQRVADEVGRRKVNERDIIRYAEKKNLYHILSN